MAYSPSDWVDGLWYGNGNGKPVPVAVSTPVDLPPVAFDMPQGVNQGGQSSPAPARQQSNYLPLILLGGLYVLFGR